MSRCNPHKALRLTVLLLLIAPPFVIAQAMSGQVEVHIDSVLAANTNQGIDTRLKPMSRRLKTLFHYTTYRLVSHQEGKAPWGRMIAFTLPGGRILHVEPRGIEGDMIEMEVVLFQGERPMMTTDFQLMNRGMLLLGGPRYEQGMLIISIGAEAPTSHNAPSLSTASPEASDH